MKFLVVLMFTFVSLNAGAQVAWFPVGKDGAFKNYADKEFCESAEGQACFDTGKCPLDECSLVGDVMVPDSAKKAAKDALAKQEADAKAEKEAAQLRIKAVDWSKVKTVDDLKAIVQDLVK